VSDRDIEDVLRDVFRSREHVVAGGQSGLLPQARRRANRRRQLRVAGVAFVTAAAAMVGGLAIEFGVPDGGAGSVADSPTASGEMPAARGQTPALPHDWVWYSSLGLQIAVPGGWEVNNYGCNMTDRPSVVRAQGMTRSCHTPEPTTKNVAVIGATADQLHEGMTTRQVLIGGVPATLAEGRLPDGRYAGQLAVPSRKVYLDVRTTDEPERREILNSAHLVDVDHAGCATTRPASGAGSGAPSMIPVDPDYVAVCYYAGGTDERLQASANLGDTEIRQLVEAANAAPEGRNPDLPPSRCRDSVEVAPDVVLQFSGADGASGANGAVSRVWVTFSSCTRRGLDNGTRQAHVSREIVELLMTPLHSGYTTKIG
jgi:hypothetical protein